jgi:serine phosphatase RsbU (regulator of sigma subunit)
LILGRLNYEDGILQITGQHENVIVVRTNGEVEQINTDTLGFPIGLEADISDFVATAKVSLNSGDVVVLYTDGITEAKNMVKQLYGLERLVEIVTENRAKSVSEIKDAVIANVRDFIQEQKVFDDITLVVMKKQ